MENRIIVAIEIASSKIKGAAAAVAADGSLNVLAVEEIAATNNVRYGRIQNIREVSCAVNEIIRRLEAAPAVVPRKVTALAISLGGRSLTGVPAQATLRSPHECEINENHVQRLLYEATREGAGDKNIEATVPRNFYVNNTATRKPVGFVGDTLRGEFLMLTCGKETRQNLDRLKIDNIDRRDVRYILRQLAIGDLVLTADERELGCALVDFGAETTTVSIYKDGAPIFLRTIPMGSRLITLDLMSGLGITEEAAEHRKLALKSLAEDDVDPDTDEAEVIAYTRARAGEIAANILNQLEHSPVTDEALSSIVLVGRGAKLPSFGDLLSAQCKVPVRIAEMPAKVSFRTPGANSIDNIDIVAVLADGAKYPDWTCMTEVELPEDDGPVTFIEDDDPFVIVPDEPEEPVKPAPKPQEREPRKPQPEPEPHRPVRGHEDDEDDEDLLNDDPEDDEPTGRGKEKAKKGKGFGFFSFGKKKKNDSRRDPEDDYEEDAYEDEGEYEDEGYDDEQEADTFDVFRGDEDDERQRERDEDQRHNNNPGEETYHKATIVLNNIRDTFSKIFSSDYDDTVDE